MSTKWRMISLLITVPLGHWIGNLILEGYNKNRETTGIDYGAMTTTYLGFLAVVWGSFYVGYIFDRRSSRK